MVNSTDFAKRLDKILDFYGLSATAFSDQIDFNRSTISHLLSGRNKPSLEFVMKVVQKFPEVELYWLLNGKGSFPPQQKTPTPTEIPSEEKKSAQGDLFQEKEMILPKNVTDHFITKSSNIERIVIFYKDGSFKAYEN